MKEWHIFRWWHEKKFVTHRHERMTHAMKRSSIRIGMKESRICRLWHEKKFVTHRHERITHLLFLAWKEIRYTLAWKNDASLIFSRAGTFWCFVVWGGYLVYPGQTDKRTDKKKVCSLYIYETSPIIFCEKIMNKYSITIKSYHCLCNLIIYCNPSATHSCGINIVNSKPDPAWALLSRSKTGVLLWVYGRREEEEKKTGCKLHLSRSKALTLLEKIPVDNKGYAWTKPSRL